MNIFRYSINISLLNLFDSFTTFFLDGVPNAAAPLTNDASILFFNGLLLLSLSFG